jgi:hypothetical protein
MRDDELLRRATEYLKGSAEAQRLAREELDTEGWESPQPEVPRPSPGVRRRPPGRPAWTEKTFLGAYREARDRAGGLAATDKEIAAEMGLGLQQLQRLARRFGRPI